MRLYSELLTSYIMGGAEPEQTMQTVQEISRGMSGEPHTKQEKTLSGSLSKTQ